LNQVLESTLVLLHPLAPFITETIWRSLGHEDLLAAQLLPIIVKADKVEAGKFEEVQDIVAEARRLIAATGAKKPKLYYQNAPLLEEQGSLIERLGRLGAVQESHSQPSGLKLVKSPFTAWLDIDKQTAQAYAEKLATQQAAKQANIKRLEDRLANKYYTEKAPSEMVEQTRQQLTEEQSLLSKIQEEIKIFAESSKA
jgi:valyl-tRNA synthetase